MVQEFIPLEPEVFPVCEHRFRIPREDGRGERCWVCGENIPPESEKEKASGRLPAKPKASPMQSNFGQPAFVES